MQLSDISGYVLQVAGILKTVCHLFCRDALMAFDRVHVPCERYITPVCVFTPAPTQSVLQYLRQMDSNLARVLYAKLQARAWHL